MSNIKSGAYQIINEINGHSYVGSSKNIKNRWARWRYSFKTGPKYKSILKSAVQKYGIQCFTFIILEECDPTKESLEACEQKYIDLYHPEYNILKKAYSPLGYKHSKETIQRIKDTYSDERKLSISKKQIEFMSILDNRENLSKFWKGKSKKQGANLKGSNRHPDTGKNILLGFKISLKRKEYNIRRIGKTNGKSSTGEYGIRFNKISSKYWIRIQNKNHGSFKTIGEAIIKRDSIVMLNTHTVLKDTI